MALDQRRLGEAIGLYREAFEIREYLKNPLAAPAPPIRGAARERPGAGLVLAASSRTRPLNAIDALQLQRESMADVLGLSRD